MPELPEVETMRRGVAVVAGGEVRGIEACPCPRKPIAITPGLRAIRRRVVGRRIEAVERAGKRLVVRLDSRDRLVIEPRMSGLVGAGEPPSTRYLRLRFEVAGAAIGGFWYWDVRGLGHVRLLDEGRFARELGESRLGPDGLGVTGEALRERLAGSRRAVKVALLDQRAVAGIGNIYAAELLHEAGVHPASRCDRIGAARWDAIAAAARAVLAEAVLREGSSLGDGTYVNALGEPGSYQNHHRVYGREGAPCPRCGATVRRVVQAQRSTFFCPGCQTRSR